MLVVKFDEVELIFELILLKVIFSLLFDAENIVSVFIFGIKLVVIICLVIWALEYGPEPSSSFLIWAPYFEFKLEFKLFIILLDTEETTFPGTLNVILLSVLFEVILSELIPNLALGFKEGFIIFVWPIELFI